MTVAKTKTVRLTPMGQTLVMGALSTQIRHYSRCAQNARSEEGRQNNKRVADRLRSVMRDLKNQLGEETA